MPFGEHSYRLLIDGKWTYIEDKPNTIDRNGGIVNLVNVKVKQDNSNNESSLDLSSLIKPIKCPLFYCHKFVYKNKVILNENSAYSKIIPRTEHPNINHLISINSSARESLKNPLIKIALSIRVREKVLTICYYKPSSSSSTSIEIK